MHISFQRLISPDDLTPLTDINWVHATMERLASTESSTRGVAVEGAMAGLSLRKDSGAERTRAVALPTWEDEGVRLETLKL